jgi:hypothetical protein
MMTVVIPLEDAHHAATFILIAILLAAAALMPWPEKRRGPWDKR